MTDDPDDRDDTALTRTASTPLIPSLLDDEIEAARA